MICASVLSLIAFRFAAAHADNLAYDVLIARALGYYASVQLVDMSEEDNELEVFHDRLRALRKLSTEDNRGRWFAKVDRACDVIPVWTILWCVLIYRDMRISGLGIYSNAGAGRQMLREPQKNVIDGGIIKTCTSMLTDMTLRAYLVNFAFTHLTFRKRSGMRTANRAPPGQTTEQSVWSGDAAQSAMEKSHAASGQFLDELNETLQSLRNEQFGIKGHLQTYAPADLVGREPAMCMVNTYGKGRDPFAGMSRTLRHLLRPSSQLLEFLSARVRSQSVYYYGIYAFAALQHQDAEVAKTAYDRIKKNTSLLFQVLGQAPALELPEPVLLDLQRLIRDDLYMELSHYIMKTESVQCCRRLTPRGKCSTLSGLKETAQSVDMALRGDSSSMEMDDRNMENPLETQQPRAQAGTGKMPMAALQSEPCPEECSCGGCGEKLSLLTQDLFCGLHGTKIIEEAFNCIRSVRVSQGVNSKGRAENTEVTKYMAQHSNSIKKAKEKNAEVIRLNQLDFDSSGGLQTNRAQLIRQHFVGQDYESHSAFYCKAKTLLGWGEARASGDSEAGGFTMVAPKAALGVALVVELITRIQPSQWSQAWKSSVLPAGVILWSPHRQEFRVTLAVPSSNMVATWPCRATCEGTMCEPQVHFQLQNVHDKDVSSLFIFVHMPKHPDEAEPEGLDPNTVWYAVRTELCCPTSHPVPVGSQLRVATASPKLTRPQNSHFLICGAVMLDENEPKGAHVKDAPFANVMDTVPVMEYLVEIGMKNASLGQSRKLLFECLFSQKMEAGEADAEPFEVVREKTRKECQGYDMTQIFQKMLNIWCNHMSPEEQQKALMR